MGIFLREHITHTLALTDDVNLVESNRSTYLLNQSEKIQPRIFKIERGKKYPCFHCQVSEEQVKLDSGYFVGLDWLTKDRYIHIEPKMNTAVFESFERLNSVFDTELSDEEIKLLNIEVQKQIQQTDSIIEIDIIAMLMDIMSHSGTAKQTNNLFLIDWEAPEIPITQKQDLLTPFLIVKFLKLLQDISRKGLKKSYYKVQDNLRNKVKGKILVGKQIKQNIFNNRFTNTVCEYQVFGEDSMENRFLKKVFLFCTQYVENNSYYFNHQNNILSVINYIRPTFEQIGTEVNMQDIKHMKYNPFFKEYKEAINIGQHILKRFSYTITKTMSESISTPPFWIDMSKMFELYVYGKFLDDNSTLSEANFNYQFSTPGNSLDFLICDKSSNTKIVVDTKYKLRYNHGKIHSDIRQVSGYSRLKKVKEKEPKISEEIPCLIIYPKPIGGNSFDEGILKIDNLLMEEIEAYHKVYKLGVDLPIITR